MAYFRQMLRAGAGYMWALLALPIILATFMGGDYWARQLISFTGIKVSPWLTGGDIIQTIEHGPYRTLIHRAVFDGLIGQRSRGFIQIDWQPETGFLPGRLNELIDYNRDGFIDFKIRLDTIKNQAWLVNKKPYVVGIESIYQLGHERVIRVLLINRRNHDP